MDKTTKAYDGWIGRDAYDRADDKVGKIDSSITTT